MKPLVAIVGRPNVGKSTLLNRLVGRRVALVADQPGVTRDRIFAEACLGSRGVLLVDTGGFDPRPADDLGKKVMEQTRAAIEEAEAILLVCDGKEGVHPLDGQMADLLRKSRKTVFCLVNKIDPGSQDRVWEEFFALGFETLPVSALHAAGMDALCRRLEECLDEEAQENGTARKADFSLCLLGRPNVGKSSLANCLLGQQRQIVSEIPGTTRDAVDLLVEREGLCCVLVDTPGVRRRSRIEQPLEYISVMAALKKLSRSDVAALLLDATEPVADQDARLARLVQEQGKGLLLLLNKIDALPMEEKRREAAAEARHVLRFVSYAPMLQISALTGEGVGEILPLARRVREALGLHLATGPLNRLVAELMEKHPPPLVKGKRPRIYFVSQAGGEPPTLVAKVNHPEIVSKQYLRYLENRLRENYDLCGVPLRWLLRPHQQHPAGGGRRWRR